jgi:hypothetical protein
MDIKSIEKAKSVVGHRQAKIEAYQKLSSVDTVNPWINLVAKEVDRTGIIQASIDRPRNVEFSLRLTSLLHMLAEEIQALELELINLGVTGVERFSR